MIEMNSISHQHHVSPNGYYLSKKASFADVGIPLLHGASVDSSLARDREGDNEIAREMDEYGAKQNNSNESMKLRSSVIAMNQAFAQFNVARSST